MSHAIGIAIVVTLLAFGQSIVYSEREGDEGVSLLQDKMYTDESGLVRIVGLVENSTDEPIGFVRVTANLFDKNGHTLPKYSTLTLIRTVMPGSIGPFDIAISDQIVGSKVASYSISLEWKEAQEKPDLLTFSDVKTYAVTHMDPSTFKYVNPHAGNEETHKPIAHSETSGSISNSGDISSKRVKVVAVWYDKEGKISAVDWQLARTRLAPGEAGVFVIMRHVAAGYYSLIAESEDYVSVLTNGNEMVMPVYEAKKAGMATNALDMRGISFADENNEPVSLLTSGHQVQLVSTIESKLSTQQKFVCIFQIVDEDGITVMLSWIASEIGAGGTAEISVSWIPDSEGAYSIKTFLWQGITNPVPLSSEADSLVVEVK
ncbi:MAG: FxLYD domain-containing protein [Nitrososphaerales archaeon]